MAKGDFSDVWDTDEWKKLVPRANKIGHDQRLEVRSWFQGCEHSRTPWQLSNPHGWKPTVEGERTWPAGLTKADWDDWQDYWTFPQTPSSGL